MTLPRTAAIRMVAPETISEPTGIVPRTARGVAGRIAHGDAATIAEISAGLLAPQAFTAPKYFYDSLGSHLFEAICELPEYYPTRTEAAIFARHGAAMAERIGPGATLVDLGAGNCAKAASLFPLLQPRQYVPVDIASEFLQQAATQLRQRFPSIDITPLVMDLAQPLSLPPSVPMARRQFFYPGSSIGNFTPPDAVAFLRQLRGNVGADGGLLIGVDLVKDPAVLDAAYDDAIGVTAAFNLNLLRHLNHLAGADFEPAQWRHVAFFNDAESRIEMHLEARRALVVHWCAGERAFAQGERIHTENSYKYTVEGFRRLLSEAGLHVDGVWTDDARWFAVMHAAAANA